MKRKCKIFEHKWQEESDEGFLVQTCQICNKTITSKLYQGTGRSIEYNVGRSKDIYRGYNEGLGKNISGKRQWVEEQKKHNIKSVG